MGTYTFNPSTSNGGSIATQATSYATAREGTGTKTAFTTDPMSVGQYNFNNATYQCYESFLEFDTSSLAGKTIISAVLKLYVTAKQEDVTYTVEARLQDFGASFTSADYVRGSDLAASTLLATLASSAAGTGAYRSFTDVAFPANVNKTGKTRIIVSSDHPRTNTAPAKNVDEYIQFTSPSGSNPPQLVVVTSDEGALSKSIGNITLSSAVAIETHGDLNKSIGTIGLSAAGLQTSAGTGVLDKSIGNITLSSTIGIETFGVVEASIGEITLNTAALVPREGVLSQSIGEIGLSSVIARDTTGALSKSIGEITLQSTNQTGLNGALSKSIGEIVLTAAESAPPWPFIYDFPQTPLEGTWQPELGDDTLRSDRDVGARQRRTRNGGNYASVTFAIMLKTKAQRLELDRFYAEACKHGTVPFTWEDPETGDIERWTWAAAPLRQHVARENYRVECALRKEAA